MNKKIVKKIDKITDVLGRAMIITVIIVLAAEFIIIGIFGFKIFYASAQTAPAKKAVNPANVPQIAVPIGDFYRECAVCAAEDTAEEQNACYGKFDSTKCFDVQHPENWIGQYVLAWFGYLVGAIGIIAVVMVMWGGIKWITSGGNSSQIEEAKGKIKNAVIGIILLLGAYTIFKTVNPQLLNLSLPPIDTVAPPPEICCQNIETKIKSLRYECFADEEERKDITDSSLCQSEMPKIINVCTKENSLPPQGLYNTESGQIDASNSCGHFNYVEKCIYTSVTEGMCIITEKKDGNLTSGRIVSSIPALKGFWDNSRKVGKDANCGEPYLHNLLGMYIGSSCSNGGTCWAKQKYNNDRPYEFYCDNTLMKTFETNGNTSTATEETIASASINSAEETEIRDFLKSFGIKFNHENACLLKETSGCTTLAGLRQETINEMIFLAEKVGRGNVTITGGTEAGHSILHTKGFKFDVSKTEEIEKYVKNKNKKINAWSDKTKVYVMENDVEYANELGGDPHWDVCVNCASG